MMELHPTQPFRGRAFRWLFTATLVWNLARWMEMLVSAWLAYTLTHSAWDVALIGFFRSVPLLLLGVVGGLTADGRDRRQTLVVAQIVNGMAVAMIAVLLGTHRLAYWQLAVCAAVLGTTWVFDWPSRRALLPDLVHRRCLLRAFAFDNLNMNTSKIIGPLIAGSLLASLGPTDCYIALAGVYLGALLPLLPLPRSRRTVRIAQSLAADLGAGFRAVRSSQTVLGVLAITVALNMLVFPYQQLLPVFGVAVLRLGPAGIGLLGAGNGVGSLVGSCVMVWQGQRARQPGRLFIAGSFIVSLAIVLFAGSHWFLLCFFCLALSGLGQSAFGALQTTIIVSGVSSELRGRAMGILTLAIGSSPIGALLVGGVAQADGPAVAIGAASCAALLLVVVVACLFPGLHRPTPLPSTDPPLAPHAIARG